MSNTTELQRFEPSDNRIIVRLATLWGRSRSLRDDSQRRSHALAALLAAPEVLWYNGPCGSIWYLTDRDARTGAASVHVLASSKWLWRRQEQVRGALTQLMDENGLRKLYVLIPGPVKIVKRLALRAAFKHEGTLRETIVFDGRWVNLDIYGVLRRELSREMRHGRARRKQGEQEGVLQAQGDVVRPDWGRRSASAGGAS